MIRKLQSGQYRLYSRKINPKTGKTVKTLKNVVQLGASPTPLGHTGWTSISDWFRG